MIKKMEKILALCQNESSLKEAIQKNEIDKLKVFKRDGFNTYSISINQNEIKDLNSFLKIKIQEIDTKDYYKLYEIIYFIIILNINEELKINKLLEIFKKLNTIDERELLKVFIEKINKIEWENLNYELDIFSLNDIISRGFYSNRPTQIFNYFYSVSEYKGIEEILEGLKPVYYCMFISQDLYYHFNIEFFWKEFKTIIKNKNISSKKMAFLLNRFDDKMISIESLDILEEYLFKNWFEIGSYIFIKQFENINRFKNENTGNNYKYIFTNIFVKLEKTNENYLSKFEWIKDYKSIMNFLMLIEKDGTEFQILKNQIYENFKKNLRLCKAENCEQFLKEGLFKGLYDIFESSQYRLFNLSSNVIFNSDDKKFVEWLKVLDKMLDEIQILYYSTNSLLHYKLDIIISQIILLHLNFIITQESISQTQEDRVEKGLSMISEKILTQFLRKLELRNEEIWNYKKTFSTQELKYKSKEIYLLNYYMTKIEKQYPSLIVYKSFAKKWKKKSTTIWEWMDKNESI